MIKNMNTSVHFTMSTSTLFRNIAQQIKRKPSSNSTLVLNRSISNKKFNESQTLKLSKDLRVHNMSSISKKISETQTVSTSKRPYTVVVEGNIGSGKVSERLWCQVVLYLRLFHSLRSFYYRNHVIHRISDNVSCTIYER